MLHIEWSDNMPKKICNTAGCSELIDMDKNRCSKHVSVHVEYNKHRRDKERDKFYHSKAWKLKREEVLSAYGGLCQMCKDNGLIVDAKIVDHIVELSDGGEELDTDNLIPLCISCHNSKTSIEVKRRNNDKLTAHLDDDYIYC